MQIDFFGIHVSNILPPKLPTLIQGSVINWPQYTTQLHSWHTYFTSLLDFHTINFEWFVLSFTYTASFHLCLCYFSASTFHLHISCPNFIHHSSSCSHLTGQVFPLFFTIYSLLPPRRSNSQNEGYWWRWDSPWNQINLGSSHCFNISGNVRLGKIFNLINQIGIVIICISLDVSHFPSYMIFCNMTKPSYHQKMMSLPPTPLGSRKVLDEFC